MLTIRNLELKRSYFGDDYRRARFVTTAEVMIGEGYSNKATITLTDEQTGRAVDFILGMIREGLTVEIEKPVPVERPAPFAPPVRELEDLEPL